MKLRTLQFSLSGLALVGYVLGVWLERPGLCLLATALLLGSNVLYSAQRLDSRAAFLFFQAALALNWLAQPLWALAQGQHWAASSFALHCAFGLLLLSWLSHLMLETLLARYQRIQPAHGQLTGLRRTGAVLTGLCLVGGLAAQPALNLPLSAGLRAGAQLLSRLLPGALCAYLAALPGPLGALMALSGVLILELMSGAGAAALAFLLFCLLYLCLRASQNPAWLGRWGLAGGMAWFPLLTVATCALLALSQGAAPTVDTLTRVSGALGNQLGQLARSRGLMASALIERLHAWGYAGGALFSLAAGAVLYLLGFAVGRSWLSGAPALLALLQLFALPHEGIAAFLHPLLSPYPYVALGICALGAWVQSHWRSAPRRR